MAGYCDVPGARGYPTIRPMAAGKSEDTALGTAQGRFIESLPRKAIELRGAIALLTATPAAEGPREDMRRRLHTLYASAVVFRNEALSVAVKEGIERLDTARDEARALNASGPGDARQDDSAESRRCVGTPCPARERPAAPGLFRRPLPRLP